MRVSQPRRRSRGLAKKPQNYYACTARAKSYANLISYIYMNNLRPLIKKDLTVGLLGLRQDAGFQKTRETLMISNGTWRNMRR